ncbi:DUF2269 domain-containing protein [Aquabacterium sp. A7-Y]|uniref:DUF2269 family protein n=1 Tax=Aquabacterium sp. A7-Y TaxID=1349605 RepID=UPI00223E0FBE|nr:DUF2269 domain-containing protein [Aquabacterium sp. A7-Y]MCW7537395.1 DUF2269 domain-containing protein [Aquabacterium sp. A7-Y]
MEYLVVKWLHVLSSTFLFGTGVGSAFYLLFASLGRDARAVAVVSGLVVRADWLFTSTTIVFQPLSGFYMMHLAGMSFDAAWIRWSLWLYVIATACWLPVVWLQIVLRRIARDAAARGAHLPAMYFRHLKVWVVLGVPAFFAFVMIFYLMVAKPA